MNTCRWSIALLILATALLAGCVTFETAPVAEMGCDAALAGHWISEEQAQDRDRSQGAQQQRSPSDVTTPGQTIELTSTCDLVYVQENGTVTTRRFATFEFDGYRYIAWEQDEALTVLDLADRPVETWPASRLTLSRYRHDGNTLTIFTADPDIATRIDTAGVRVHLDEVSGPAAGRPAQRKIASDVYLSGESEAIADALRAHGNDLYGHMNATRASGFVRVEGQGTTP